MNPRLKTLALVALMMVGGIVLVGAMGAAAPAEPADLSGCNRVPSAVAERVFGQPITATNALVETANGGNCMYTIGEGNTLVFNYTQAIDATAAQSTYEFQVEGFLEPEDIPNLGDEAAWSEGLDMLIVRFDNEVMQTRFLAGGTGNDQREALIQLVSALER